MSILVHYFIDLDTPNEQEVCFSCAMKASVAFEKLNDMLAAEMIIHEVNLEQKKSGPITALAFGADYHNIRNLNCSRCNRSLVPESNQREPGVLKIK